MTDRLAMDWKRILRLVGQRSETVAYSIETEPQGCLGQLDCSFELDCRSDAIEAVRQLKRQEQLP